MKRSIKQVVLIIAGVLLISKLPAQNVASAPDKPRKENIAADTNPSQPNTVIKSDNTTSPKAEETPVSKGRNCTANKSSDPFTVSRKDFDKMPAATKEFILTHSEKYIIKD